MSTESPILLEGQEVSSHQCNKEKQGPQFIFAIGDIHGHTEELGILLRKITRYMQDYPGQSFQVVTLGDYLNRGPDAKGVLDRLIAFRNALPEYGKLITIKGNNDVAVLDFMAEEDSAACHEKYQQLVRKGLLQTLASYGWFQNPNVFPPSDAEALSARNYLRTFFGGGHRDFLEGLITSHTVRLAHENLLFCHGGVDVSKPLEEQDDAVLLGMDKKGPNGLKISKEFARTSGAFLKDSGSRQYTVVHGHTIIGRYPDITDGRCSVDTGCYKKGGALSCLIMADGVPIDVLACSNLYVAFSREAMVTPDTWPPRKTWKGHFLTWVHERLKNSP
ncbi:MAG: metallophosphoesterase [Alphaproteobacteria bacterium]|nr:metallophosphoesterase [Alphaproteobacteria bacterium]